MDIPRISFHINLILDTTKPIPVTELEICDIGGGIGIFSVGCAALGMKRTVLIDDFEDPVNKKVGASILDMHKRLGVEIITRDVIKKGIQDIEGTYDVITTFDSMEHWHNSPKRLFRQVVEKMNKNGFLILGVPNCVNMRKRITVPLGIGKWSQMKDWYEEDTFRGHVREPDTSDLIYITHDMGLVDRKIYGRNWLGYISPNSTIRLLTKILDYPLRIKPSLCSDIYVVGRKP